MQSPNVKEAKTLENHKLLIKFMNDEEKVFNMEPYLHFPVFKPLQDMKEFNDFIIEDGTIEWKCGADLSPDTFYIESIPVKVNDALGK
ncbi:MAG: DUF2442 domain-containing protein [Firmicutes bacterium]|nr:DUF2442 domain-containing protein [Bacillota bacterium]